MKRLITILTFLFIGIQLSFGQSNLFKSLRFDLNLDVSNKKRSHGVYTGEKYAKTGSFTGLDFAVYYQTKLFNYGIEYFSAYNHLNASFGYRGLIIDDGDENSIIRFVPDLKLGYTPVLKKIYYGLGMSLRINWFTIGYSKILHVKSGSSKYHGDGLNVFSVGVSLRIKNKRD